MWRRRRGVDLLDTPEMDAFFERLDHLNQAQLLGLQAAWQSADRRAHKGAWAAVWEVGVRDGLTKEIGRVRDKAMAWVSRDTALAGYQFFGTSAWVQAKRGACDAIVDVALATALGSRLDARYRDVLIRPWLRATEGED
jgi:hypothetical protein